MYYDEEQKRYIAEVPTTCPKHDKDLELDAQYDGRVLLQCPDPECDYEFDATEELGTMGGDVEE